MRVESAAPSSVLAVDPRRRQERRETSRVTVDGKQLRRGGQRFAMRGATYGTFSPRADGARYPARPHMELDFASMQEHGFNVVRTYTEPAPDVLQCATDQGLGVLAGVFYEDWRYLIGGSRRQQRAVAAEARAAVRGAARRLAGTAEVVGLVVGNEVPADVIRWLGRDRVSSVIEELVDVAHDEDPELLVTYANYPTAEYLSLEALDFLTFNVFLEDQQDYRRYLTRLQHLAGDRPLVLGEIGVHADAGPDGERRQAEVLDWQLETALERGVAGTCVFSWTDEWWVGDQAVEGWHFGLTDAERRPRAALEVAERWNSRSVAELPVAWPSISVVVCAYQAEATLDECLAHTCALTYPDLEVVVVDDGSTDATAAIAERYPDVRLVRIDHAGLAFARNAGLDSATGELVAYLDSDAYPSPEWPYYLALGMDGATIVGVGGPNLPPPGDPATAQAVARAPGGPVHVLLADDRAEHVPGCNMAFWRDTLIEVGGFDPIYTAAGDDVDLCWKVLDRGHDIGFHPAALVWHHRRSGVGAYLRQQRGYGRSEALVEARHPNRFTATGAARWRGVIYDSFAAPTVRQRIYRGAFGTALFQSVYRGGGHILDLVHQVGVPLALLLLLTAPLGLLEGVLVAPAAAAAAFLAGLLLFDAMGAPPRPPATTGGVRWRLTIASLHQLQPLARLWGRLSFRSAARREVRPAAALPPLVRTASGGTRLLAQDRPREDLVATVLDHLRAAGVRVLTPSGWEAYDARLVGSTFVFGELVTSSAPTGWVQLRVRPRLRALPLATLAVVVVAALLAHPGAAAVIGLLGAGELVRGILRSRAFLDGGLPKDERRETS